MFSGWPFFGHAFFGVRSYCTHTHRIYNFRKMLILGRFCKPNPVRFSERSASRFWPGKVKVHTNMCEPKVCFAKIERFSKPNIRFGSGRTGSKIVSKFRLTHNRKLRSANRNTIYHTIACPALLLWCPAVENRGPCLPKKCSLSNCASPGDSFCQVLDHW